MDQIKIMKNKEKTQKKVQENTKEWYFIQIDKFLSELCKKNGVTNY